MFFSTAYAQEAKTSVVNLSTWDAVLHASFVVQLTLVMLISMSIISWAIIIFKKFHINTLRDANNNFLDVFWKSTSLDDIFDSINEFPDSNLARVFKAGYLELRKIADSNLAKEKSGVNSPMLSGIDNLQRSLQKSSDTELARLESKLSFLATTGSTGPFIGLFGTVWGIMGAFRKIGETNMASLAVVAPGISEALIATAIGLATAIPATIAYNHFVNALRKEELDLNNFCSDFVNIAKRNFFKDA